LPYFAEVSKEKKKFSSAHQRISNGSKRDSSDKPTLEEKHCCVGLISDEGRKKKK